MAKFENARLSYNNTDDPERTYDMYATVVVNNGEVTKIENLQANKQGASVVTGSITDLTAERSNSNFNSNSIPATEIPVVISALVDFALNLAATIDAGAANPIAEE